MSNADEPELLQQLGFRTPLADDAVAAPTSRREARALESRATSGSAQKRIRTVQKSYAKPPKRGRGRAAEGERRPVAVAPAPSRPVTSSPSRARTVGSRLLSVAAMVFAGALAIGMSVPANAFDHGAGDSLLAGVVGGGSAAEVTDGQSVEVAETAATTSAARDAFTVTSWAEMLRLKYGTRDYSYTLGDPNGPIRWPFPYAVPISSGFGERAAPCLGCSTIHMGIDFNPGVGAPIYAIAAGIVKQAEDGNGGYGNYVYIDHGNLLGDGANITSLYAHMQHGSVALQVGDTVQVGDFIGTVGQTGQATGPHLHFELLVDGVQVDGFAWLRANA